MFSLVCTYNNLPMLKLMISMLGKTFSRQHLEIFFSYFFQKNIINLLSAEFALQVVKFKY